MINPQWLELPMARTIFYGPKDVRAIEVRLYMTYDLYFQGHLYILFDIAAAGVRTVLRTYNVFTIVQFLLV